MLVKSGTWKTNTATEDHFVALTAEIAALEQANANKRGEGGQADSHSKEGGQKVKGSNQKKRKNTHPPGSPQLQRRENRRKRLLGWESILGALNNKYWWDHEPAVCFKIQGEPLDIPTEKSFHTE